MGTRIAVGHVATSEEINPPDLFTFVRNRPCQDGVLAGEHAGEELCVAFAKTGSLAHKIFEPALRAPSRLCISSPRSGRGPDVSG